MALSKCRYVVLAANISTVYIALGLLLSLQPPFYPSEAEKKGAKPAEYGFVFGIANLSLFLFSPIFGKFGARIGAKTCFNIGAVLQGTSGFLFAFLPFINDVGVFIGLSYLLRFLEGMGTAMAWSSALGILMKIFPNKVARVMSFTQTCFGLGYMLGPAVGAALYEVGGFMLPFLIVGAVSTILSLCLIITIPHLSDEGSQQQGNSNNNYSNSSQGVTTESQDETENFVGQDSTNEPPPLGFLSLFSSLRLLLPFVDLFAALCGNGMLESMLEPHLREVKASTIDIGVTFLMFGCAYMFGNLFFGAVMDKVGRPIYFSVLGNTAFLTAFLLIGPVPFVPLKPEKSLIQGMMIFAGVAYSAMVVSSFARAQKRVLELGFANSMHTHVMISGIWMSSFALGNFVGPTIGGVLVQTMDFEHTTIVFFAMYLVMIAIDILLSIKIIVQRSRSSPYEEIP